MSIHQKYNEKQLPLSEADSEIYDLIHKEELRQRNKLEMIASENFVSRAVLEAASSVLTNKYAEGYYGNRYYGGCEVIDQVEYLAIERAKKLFGAEYANVQPHSGSSANVAAYSAFLNAGDCIMGMDLAHGGHLTHGSSVSLTGKIYKAVHYGVDRETELLNYDEILRLAKEHRPKLIIAGASAYSRVIDFEKFANIAKEVGALLLADIAHISGLVATGLHPSPIMHADVVTTTTHKTLRGARGGLILAGKDKEYPVGTERKVKKYSSLINSATIPGLQGGPLMHIIAAKAVSFKEALSENFKTYQQQIVKNAKALAEHLKSGGMRIVSGGTDNHLMLADVKSSYNVTGKAAGNWLDDANITANKNGIPFDTESPFVCSGIRFGVQALTTRGMKEKEMQEIAEYIITVVSSKGEQSVIDSVGKSVLQLTSRFPMYTS